MFAHDLEEQTSIAYSIQNQRSMGFTSVHVFACTGCMFRQSWPQSIEGFCLSEKTGLALKQIDVCHLC